MKNLDILNVEQGSEDWHKGRHGVITASMVSKVLAKKGTETRAGYMADLVAQIATGSIAEIDGPSLRWGKEHEQDARSAYEFLKDIKVEEVGFIYGKDRRVGASPDGLIISQSKGVEIKCPHTSKVHVEFLVMDKIKLEYIYQCQFALWLSGLETWDFCSYDPRFKKDLLKVYTLEPDIKLFERFENETNEFIKEMDEMLAKLQISFGDQWRSND